MHEAVVRTEGHKYFPEIDGLRAIAVIAVIVNHLNAAVLPSGYLGVDVFFVISGYVITLSLLDRRHLAVSTIIAEFYVRRIKRLAPALALTVIAGATLIRLFDPAPVRSTITGALSLFGLSNFFLYYEAIDYFGPGVQLNPFSHTWSLGVEEQFYVFYPLMLLIGHQARPGLGFRFTLVGVLSAASLVGFAFVYGRDQPATYFLLPFRFWELGIGCLLAIQSWEGSDAYRRWAARLTPTLPLLLMIGVFFLPRPMPVMATVLAVACSALLLMSIRSGTAAYSVLTQRTVVYVGLLSYSLYLWHWIVICLSTWTVGIHLWTVPFQLLAMVALAAASFHLVENPLRRRPWFRPRWLTIVTGLAGLTVASGVLAIGHRYNLPRFSGSYELNEVARAGPMPGYRGKYSGRAIDECSVSSVWSADPATIQKRLVRCTATIPGRRPHLVFAGDSHSMDLFPLAELLFKKKLATVTNTYQPGCRVPPLVGEGAECARAMDILNRLPADPAHRSVLVLRNNYSPTAAEGTGTFVPPLESIIDTMDARGYTVVYVAPAPKYYSLGPGSLCSVQWFRPRWALSARCSNGFVEDRGEELARRRDFTAYLLTLEMRRHNLVVFDPFDALCGGVGRTCTPVRDGELIYRDDSHLTERGSELLTDPFARFLKNNKLLD